MMAMTSSLEHLQSRREWLRGCLRYGLLAGIGTGAAVLAVRRGGTASPVSCERRIACRDCDVRGSCRLPAKLSIDTEREDSAHDQ